MTRYNTPAEGTLDWHVPLNENFTQLGTDVEIRDAEANRDQYEPSDGGKFFATDTGAVYIGDGNQWNFLGEVVPEQTGGGGGSIVAGPGNVQSAIDTVAQDGGGGVLLNPTEVYPQPSSPWRVEEGVTLHFNGAWIVGDGGMNNTDILHIKPGARIINPRIDLYDGGNAYDGGNEYRGNVFVLDTNWGRYFANGTRVQGGHITNIGSSGRGVYLNVDSERTHITHCSIEFDMGLPRGVNEPKESMGVGVEMNTEGINDGWINSVHVSGFWRYPDTGLLQRGSVGDYNQQTRNVMDVTIQPSDSGAVAFWRITDPTFAKRNFWRGSIWDLAGYGSTAWEIESSYQGSENWRGTGQNAVFTPDANGLAERTQSNSPKANYIHRWWDMDTREV